jgi:ectoine hydroxylase-related dioxygenase (phytanoyl-CoA dioxygenase family)
MTVTTLPQGTPIAAVMREIEDQGCVIVESLISDDLLRRLKSEIELHAARVSPGPRIEHAKSAAFHGRQTKRFTALAARCPSFVEFLENPLMQAWADAALLPVCGSYWLNTGQAMLIGPGQRAQVLHRDQDNWPVFTAMGDAAPEITVSCMLALTEFTEETGATRVVPGTHRGDFKRTYAEEESVPALMRPGSGLLYSGKVVHGGGANRTHDQWRYGLHMSFVAGWLCPEEASPLGVPYEIARRYSERTQRLLGYRSTAPDPRGVQVWLLDFEEAALTLAQRELHD